MNDWLKKRLINLAVWLLIVATLIFLSSNNPFSREVFFLLITAMIELGISILLLLANPTSKTDLVNTLNHNAWLNLPPEYFKSQSEKVLKD